jgi:hypothetical protein
MSADTKERIRAAYQRAESLTYRRGSAGELFALLLAGKVAGTCYQSCEDYLAEALTQGRVRELCETYRDHHPAPDRVPHSELAAGEWPEEVTAAPLPRVVIPPEVDLPALAEQVTQLGQVAAQLSRSMVALLGACRVLADSADAEGEP